MLFYLMLLFVGCSDATHFLGTVMTYYPTGSHANGSVSVLLRYKLNFVSCSHSDAWQCGGNCGTENQSLALTKVEEVSGEWCQREGAITHLLPNNTGFETVLAGGNWISNIQNSVVSWKAATNVELRTRSDIGKPNTSPQTTILPALRIPSNCPRIIDLLAFDPDGDEVKCRKGIASSECNPCTFPSVLSLSSSCSLSFNSSFSSIELPYAVQLVMEDFPTQNINLTQTDGSQEMKTTNDAISKIPLQFVLKVGPTVPSCTEGLYLPKFLFPTPSNRARLYTSVGQALEIPIRAEANMSMVSNLLYSGPHNVGKSSSGSGNFFLYWTPSESEEGQSHPICFIVQANVNNTLYDSELRCVIVTVQSAPTQTPSTTAVYTTPNVTGYINITQMTPTVAATTSDPGPEYIIALNMKISTTFSLDDDQDTILELIKQKLVEEGLPSSITIRLLSGNQLVVTTASP